MYVRTDEWTYTIKHTKHLHSLISLSSGHLRKALDDPKALPHILHLLAAVIIAPSAALHFHPEAAAHGRPPYALSVLCKKRTEQRRGAEKTAIRQRRACEHALIRSQWHAVRDEEGARRGDAH
jgi:hypothetical protein